MDNKFSLQGKVAVVTGASGTFGSEFSRTFAAYGADVVLAVRNCEKGERVATQLREDYGVETKVVYFEATDTESINAMAAEAWAWKGHVDVVVCTAGGNSNVDMMLPLESFIQTAPVNSNEGGNN